MRTLSAAVRELAILTLTACLLAGCGMSPLAPQNPLVGRWSSQNGSYVVEFLGTGNCTATLRMDGRSMGGPCTYTSTKDTITITYPGGAATGGQNANVVWQYSLTGDNLTISYGGVSIPLKRVH